MWPFQLQQVGLPNVWQWREIQSRTWILDEGSEVVASSGRLESENERQIYLPVHPILLCRFRGHKQWPTQVQQD
jgi:hypothetical protein